MDVPRQPAFSEGAPALKPTIRTPDGRHVSPQYRFALRLVAAVFALASIATGVVGGSDGARADTPPVYNGEIVFMRYGQNGEGSVRAVRPDGTAEHAVNAGAYPTYTPDGTQIVSLAFGGISVTSAAGLGVPFQKLPGSGGGFSMAVSPDGKRVIWTHFGEGVVNEALDGSDRKVLFGGLPENETSPTFLPDGRIAYTRQGESGSEIWTADADGGNAALALTNAGSNYGIDVSPDGSKVVFGSANGSVIADLDGTGRTVVGPTAGAPRFSPDGEWLAFGRDGTDPGIWVMRTDGSALQQLTHGADEFPDWQPRTAPLPSSKPIYNGRIAFDRNGPVEGDEQFLSVNADGTNPKAFPNLGAWAQYSGDGTKLSYCAEQGHVYVANADGTSASNLPGITCSGWGWSWSPDGSLFTGAAGEPAPNSATYTVSTWTMSGERTDLFANDGRQELWPRFTPSGELVFARNNEFWASPADGSDQQLLFARPSEIRYPMLVAGGTKSAWVEGTQLWVADIDGEHAQQIAANVHAPVPSPDGQSIAFGNYTNPSGIYVIDIDGSGLRQVTTGPDYFPAWQPLSAAPNQPPLPKFTFKQAKPHYVIASAANSTDPDGTIVSYEWRWGDGSPASTTKQAWHQYKRSGWALIRLTVTDNQGDSTTRAIWYHVN